MGELVHVGLACEVIRRCGECAIGTLPKRRACGMKLYVAVGNFVAILDP